MHLENNISIFNNLKKLGVYIGRKRFLQIILLQFLSLTSSIIDAISVGAMVPFIAIITKPENILSISKIKFLLDVLKIYNKNSLIIFITIVFVIVVFLSGLIRWLLIFFNTRLGNAINSDLSYLIYKKTLYQSYLEHTARNSSEIINGVGRGGEIVTLIITPLFLLINSIFTVLFLSLTLILINPIIIFLTLFIIGSLYLIIIYFVKDKLKEESNIISIKKPFAIKAMQEGLGGIRDILIDGTQEIYSNIFYKYDSEVKRSTAKVALITITPNIAIQTIGITVIAIFASALSTNSNLASDTFSTGLPFLGALAFSYLRMSPAIQQIYSTWANIKNGEPSLNYVVNFLQKPLPSYAGKPIPQPIKFNENIEIKNLSFRYNIDTDFVIEKVNLKINKGSKVGFVGKTGSGKSTLLDIIMALIEPSSGSFEVDGVKINSNNFRSWQVRIAHVPQAIYLSDSTILENIAFGIPVDEIDLIRAKDAAKKAQISQTIESFTLKYNTKIGERGVRLSGGQRQRLGIARALYKKADVIIFDEATSALDNNTEIEVMNSIENLDNNLTILIVAHRLSTLKNCNQIIEIKDHKLIVHDNYEMLNNSLKNS
jgi:ABC-type multidrug transport system fused ATPase/permease subunit